MSNRPVAMGMILLVLAIGVCPGAATGPATAPSDEARRAARRTPMVELFEKCAESVVTFTATRTERRPGKKPVTHTERGSGFVIHPDGYILMVAHALAKGGRPQVRLHDGKTCAARVLAQDNALDLALLKIDARRPLKPLKLGHSGDLMIGERAYALGNPYGFGLTLGAGLITGLRRSTKTNFSHLKEMIQTDAGINPGVSGGPLVNVFGEVIGVATSRKTEGDGIGFATAIDTVRAALPKMIAAEPRGGFVLGLTVDGGETAVVKKVASGSPAAAAKVRAGDVIVAVGDNPIASGVDFHLALIGRKGGQKLPLKLRRGRRNIRAAVTLGKVKLREPDQVADPAAGVQYKAYRGHWHRLPRFRRLKPVASGTMPTFALGKYDGKDDFALDFTGYVEVPADGVYTFFLLSDAGSRLYLGGKLVVDHDGLHLAVEKRGFIPLKAGKHAIRVACFDPGGEDALKVSYEGPGLKKREIPAQALFHTKPPTTRKAPKKPAKPSTRPSSTKPS